MKSEAAIMAEIRLALAECGLLMFRNNTGRLKNDKGQLVQFGLAVGSSDLIGLTPVIITPEFIGRTLAVFTAIEVKNERGKPTDAQERFIERVIDLGGIAGVARNVDDAMDIIEPLKSNKKEYFACQK
jgi:hypothetical protein